MGLGSQVIFSDRKDALNNGLWLQKKVRISRAKKKYHVSDEEAEQSLTMRIKSTGSSYPPFFNADLSDPNYYSLILNTAALSVDECVSAIMALMKNANF
jgi:cytidylate kinase